MTSLASQTFTRKTGRSGDISIPAFVTLPKSGKDQSDHSMRYRVHSNHHKSLRTHESFEAEKAKTKKTLSERLVRKPLRCLEFGNSLWYAALPRAFDLKTLLHKLGHLLARDDQELFCLAWSPSR